VIKEAIEFNFLGKFFGNIEKIGFEVLILPAFFVQNVRKILDKLKNKTRLI
jgi:hypothetical protein